MIKRILIAFSFRGMGAFSVLLLNLIITNVTTPHEAGLFFIIFALIATISPIARSGLDNAIIKAIAINTAHEKNDQTRNIIRFSIRSTLMVSGLIGLPLVIFPEQLAKMAFGKAELATPLLIAVPAIILQSLIFIYACALHGKKMVNASIFLKNIISPLICSVLLALYFFNTRPNTPDAVSLTTAYCLALAVTLLVAASLTRPFTKRIPVNLHMSPQERTSIRAAANAFFVSTVMETLTIWAAQLMCGMYLTAGEVALFASAQRVSMTVSFILMAVNAVTAPRFAAMHAKGEVARLRDLAMKSSWLTAAAALPICVIGVTFASEIMQLFGKSFAEAGTVLIILIIGQLINGLAGPASQLIMMTGHEKQYRNITTAGSLTNIALLAYAIPAHGIHGAAIVMAAVIILQTIAKLIVIRKTLGFWVFTGK